MYTSSSVCLLGDVIDVLVEVKVPTESYTQVFDIGSPEKGCVIQSEF